MKGALTDLDVYLGNLKSTENQNFQEILEEDRSILFGKIIVLLDGKDITRGCTIGFNGLLDRRNTVLFYGELGDALVDIEKETNNVAGIACGRKLPDVNFNYFMKKLPFRMNGRVSYFGKYIFNFSTKPGEDRYREGRIREPWLTKVDHLYVESEKKSLEKRYGIKADSQTEILP